MQRQFTHLQDTGFPYPEGIDPYKYENDFNYSLYDKTQMKITICAVPWDVGLIHVGNAQIGGLGNVVKFESPEERDAWLDSIEDKYTWETKYREYHTGGYIEVPLPYEKAVLYNYVYVEYNTLPVDYAEGGKKRFFFFIRSMEALAPSTCKIEILRDTFQTFIYDVNVKHIMLERGHAPMALNSADRYLSNPIENNEYLLAEDVNFSGAYRRKYATSKIFNSGDMWAVIISSGNPKGNWGTKAANSWNTPDGTNLLDGQPTYYALAIEPENLSSLLSNIDSQIPQFKSTIKGVFFVARNLVTTGTPYSFAGYNVRPVSQKSQNLNFLQLTKAQFDYGPRYENLAKLYTFPYAYLEITSEDGNASIVKIEETSGNLSLAVTTSLAYPWLAIDTHINGIGTGAATIEFSNVSEHSFNFSGDWYSQLRRWSIPCFAVTQAASVAYDYSTHFDRIQKAEENETALNNALDNAATTKANADASAATTKANADASAVTVYDNAEDSADTSKTNADESSATTKTNADAVASTALANANANADTVHGIAYRDAQTNRTRFTNERGLAQAHTNLLTQGEYSPGYDGFMGAAAWENVQKLGDDWDQDFLMQYAVTEISEYGTSQAAVINGVSGAVSSTVGGAAAGLVAGPGGAGVGAISGLVGSAVSLATASASVPLQIGVTEDMRDVTLEAGQNKTNNAIRYARNMYNLQSTLEQNKTSADNQWLTINADLVKNTSEDDADDSRDTAKANAQRSYNTDTANNLRTYNTALANNARTYDTDINNNVRSHNTAIDNNERSYDTAIANNARTYNNSISIANRNKQTADDAISNAIKQAALEAPKEFGSFQNGETSVTRPQGIFCNIVTQAKDAIAQTGDYFLRFGYAINRAWDFIDFNVMPKFTYWKASDMWISGNNVPDEYLDEIRFFFLGGVCVWRRPEDIGNTSIYENV